MSTNAPIEVRDRLDEMAEQLDRTIPADIRKPIIDLVNDLVKHANTGAELKLADEHKGLKETLDDTSLAFLSQMKTPEERQKYVGLVRNQTPDKWVQALIDVKTPEIAAKALEDASAAQALLLPEGADRDAFTAKVKGEHDAKKIAQAFHDALVGVVGPKGEPRVAARGPGGSSSFATMADATRAFTRREITRAEWREHQARFAALSRG